MRVIALVCLAIGVLLLLAREGTFEKGRRRWLLWGGLLCIALWVLFLCAYALGWWSPIPY